MNRTLVVCQALTEPPEKFGGPEKTSQMLEEKFRADIGPGHVGMRNVRIEYAKVWCAFRSWQHAPSRATIDADRHSGAAHTNAPMSSAAGAE